MMDCKHSALFAVVVASALAGFSGVALAGDKSADKGAWATPNVPGMPVQGTGESPDEPKKPIPVPPADANSASYLQHMGAEPEKKPSPKKNKRRGAYANSEAAVFSRPFFLSLAQHR